MGGKDTDEELYPWKKKEKKLQPPHCPNCGSTDIEINGGEGYHKACRCKWDLEELGQYIPNNQ